jgi:thiosulfate/3-mercaptopyruvate sulfurtransferase
MYSDPFSNLISAQELATVLDDVVLVDARHDLAKPEAGYAAYVASHIPTAHFLHQDRDLAGHKTGRNGRHPLPSADSLAQTLRSLGLVPGKQLVVYDTAGGAFAARLWWLARWLGHEPVAVLDGGLAAWEALKLPLTDAIPARVAAASGERFGPALEAPKLVDQVMAELGSHAQTVVDARAAERYRGEVEPLDPVAGHIPGALNRPFANNLRPDGRFKPAPVLRAEFLALLGDRPMHSIVHQCGSGVTACHNMLAMHAAGLEGTHLYAGSWSEWCSDPARPVEKTT